MRLSIAAALVLLLASTARADLTDRWNATATNGSGLLMGDPTTLTWGIVADGTTISGSEGSSGSSLISFLDTNIGAGPGGPDLTLRPWFSNFDNSFKRIEEISGLTYVYEPNDGGQAIDNTSNPRGQLGVYADVRIGGHSIDGQSGSNTLAYNYFPDHGDMVIDTDNITFYSNSANSFVRFRNVVMHEGGHGVGLSHIESDNAAFLMEPIINPNFDGPQFDDILGFQRGYGDVFEKGGGNDVSAKATALGSLSIGDSLSVGNDADSTAIGAGELDFISIDGVTDTDFLSFDLTTDGRLSLLLDPMGPTYRKGPQGGTQSEFNASAQSDLTLELFDTDGVSSLGFVNDFGLGQGESLLDLLLGPGTYFAQVSGTEDATQFYRLTANFATIPEPGSCLVAAVAGLIGLGFLRRKRRLCRAAA